MIHPQALTPMQPTSCEPVEGVEYELLIGFELRTQDPIRLLLDQMGRGTLILGPPGSGKTKLVQSILRQWIFFCSMATIAIDAEGDLCDDLALDVAAQVAEDGHEGRLNDFHIIRPDFESSFQIDPFELPDENMQPLQYQAWLRRQVSLFCHACIRALGDESLDATPRLRRWLENILIAIGTAVGPDKKRLPLANIFILLDVSHPKFDAVYGLIRPHLPSEITSDFDLLISLRDRPQDVLGQVESTINRLRTLMQPLVQAAFTRIADALQPGTTVSVAALIRRRSTVLINLKDTEYFSPEQADSLGKVFIYMIVSAVQGVKDKGQRVPCGLVIDESQRFISKDVLRLICQGRKWLIRVILITQTISYFDLIEPGFADIILGQIENVITFRQRHPDDLEKLTRFIYQGNLDHTERTIEVDRHNGYTWNDVDEYAENSTTSFNNSWSQSTSYSTLVGESKTESDSWGLGKAIAHIFSVGRSDSTSESESSGQSTGNGFGTGLGLTVTDSPILEGLVNVGSTRNESQNNSSSEFTNYSDQQSQSTSTAITHSHNEGQSDVTSHMRSKARAIGHQISRGNARSRSASHGTAVSNGLTVSHKKVPLADIRTEIQYQGTPKYDYAYQLEKFKSHLYSLKQCQAVFARPGQPTITIETPFIEEPFPDLELRPHLLKAIEQRVRQIHSYYASTTDLAADNEQRLDDFIAAGHSPALTNSSPSTQSGSIF